MPQNNTTLTFSSDSRNQERVKQGFDILCPVYDLMSTVFFGKNLITSQTYFIPRLTKVKSALILGGGTGTLLLELLKHDIGESYYYLDISENMIEKSKERVFKKFPQKANQVEFKCGSYQTINAHAHDTFDLIITPYVLDCFPEKELEKVMFLLNSKLKTNGQWLFVDFNISKNSGFATFFSTFTMQLLYSFFNVFCKLQVKTLPDFSAHFSQLKFNVIHEKQFVNGMLAGRIYEKTKSES